MKEYHTFTRRPVLQALCRAVIRLLGWRIDAPFPKETKYVLIFAHHTSNWDLVIGLLAALSVGFWPQWIAKDSLFRWPFGGIMRWFGGLPVDRSKSNNFVDQIVEQFKQRDNLVIAITPEGTRSKTDYWKTGFYYIALKAGVPILTSYLDYKRKVGGIGPLFWPTGDIEADLVGIREFYAGITPKKPGLQGEVRVRPGSGK